MPEFFAAAMQVRYVEEQPTGQQNVTVRDLRRVKSSPGRRFNRQLVARRIQTIRGR